MPYHKYIIDYPMSTYDHPFFTLTTSICTDITYFPFWYKSDIVLSPSVTTINTSPYINFSDYPFLLQFFAQTSNPALAGTYNVKITGYLPNH